VRIEKTMKIAWKEIAIFVVIGVLGSTAGNWLIHLVGLRGGDMFTQLLTIAVPYIVIYFIWDYYKKKKIAG